MRVSMVCIFALSGCAQRDLDFNLNPTELPSVVSSCDGFVPSQEEISAAMPVFTIQVHGLGDPCLVLQVDSPRLPGCFSSAHWGEAQAKLRAALDLAAHPLPICEVCFGSNQIDAFGVDGKAVERDSLDLDPVAHVSLAGVSHCVYGE